MCGIAGILLEGSETEAASALRPMVLGLAHRGPDDRGEVLLGHGDWAVGLGAARLAILDPSASGHQPMADRVGRCLVYNGEIYNFRALRDELEDAADAWRSRSDTEVLLRAWARWGASGLGRLRGMFAFGLWDAAARRLVLARDPHGIKPLYYCASEHLLLFASEVRALLKSGRVPPRACAEAVSSYLSFGSVETPLAVLRDVRSLAAGHVLVAETRGGRVAWTVERYALPACELRSPAARSASAATVRSALENSVRAHLVSDVPVAAFLSGGIDSSAVVALMARVSPERPRTFTVTFRERAFSEAAYARLVAERCGTDHTEVELSDEAAAGLLPGALRAMDQPTMDGVNTYVVSRAVGGAGIKVALSGLGGDELFGGYPGFARQRSLPWLRAVPRGLRRGLASLAEAAVPSARMAKAARLLGSEASPRDVYLLSRQLFSARQLGALGAVESNEDRIPEVPPATDPFAALSLLEMGHYMANTLLRDTDCMSMAHSLEVRVPFVDREVVDAVLAVPAEHKVDRRRPKALLLDAMGDLLPEPVWRRPKKGFVLPLEAWMRSRLRNEIDDVFRRDECFLRLGLRPEAARDVWRRFLAHPNRVGWSRPWALFVLARWSEIHGVAL